MSIIQENRIVVVNLDKRQHCALMGTPIMLASSNHLPVNERGPKHDIKASNAAKMKVAYEEHCGYFALISPRSELSEILTTTDVNYDGIFGSWYGDRLITYAQGRTHYGSTASVAGNPFNTGTDTFEQVSSEVLRSIGRTILLHLEIMAPK